MTDPRTGESHKELVDGQQRSAAIKAFRDDRFQFLSTAVENQALRGICFSTLSVDQRTTFLNYQLSIDLFLGRSELRFAPAGRPCSGKSVPIRIVPANQHLKSSVAHVDAVFKETLTSGTIATAHRMSRSHRMAMLRRWVNLQGVEP